MTKPTLPEPRDRNGRVVMVGSRVRVLDPVRQFIKSLPADEIEDVSSMIGQVFEVYEIDEYGQPWVEKCWELTEGRSHSHSLALESSEMELIDEQGSMPPPTVAGRKGRPTL